MAGEPGSNKPTPENIPKKKTEKVKKDNIHKGHRERMRKRVRERGFDSLEPHEALEVLLYYAIPMRNTNPIAHELIHTFGSYHRVFEASMDELKGVKGIDDGVALFLHLLGEHERRCEHSRMTQESKRIQLDTIAAKVDYLRPQFKGLRQEIAVLLCLDNQCRPISCDFLGTGTVNASEVSVQKINELAVRHQADQVVLAHNHPRGSARPSQADIETTRQLRALLRGVGVELVEHLIFGESDFVSLAESGFFDY